MPPAAVEPPHRPRPRPAEVAQVNALTISGWILGINVAIYVLGHFILPARRLIDTRTGVAIDLASPVETWLAFSYASAVQHFELWRFVTCQFVHANLIHIAGNMLGLMSLGPIVEEYLGRRRFLAFYLLCGAVGPIAFLVLSAFSSREVYPANATLIGASAGVFGILVGAAMVAPRDWVQLIFPPTPVRLRTAAILMLCVAAYTVFAYGTTGRQNAGGEAAHLGGAAMGFYLIRRPDLLDWSENWGPRPRQHRV